MRLSQIRIENFRSFEDETVSFDNYTCFVGPNGAGKSNILTALNVFFRNNSSTSTDVCKLSEEDFHHRNTKMPVKITLTFKNLSFEEQQDFKHYYRQDQLVLFAEAKWDAGKNNAEVLQHGSRLVMEEFASFFEAMDRKALAGELKEIYQNIKKGFPSLPSETTKPGMEKALRDYEENHQKLCKPIDDPTQAYGWAKGTNLLKKYIEWVYIPAVKDASTEQEENNKTALGQLLHRTIRSKIDFKTPLDLLKRDIEKKYKDILNDQNDMLMNLKESLKLKLREWTNPGANLDLKWHYDNEKSIIVEEPNAKVLIGEGSFLGEVARLGHGMQRAFLVSILQELAGSNQELSSLLLLGIEEPELYQHPPQAMHMANLLVNIAEEAKSKSQVIVSTHSPYFVSAEKFENIRMVRKIKKKEVSKVNSTNYSKLEERISKALGQKAGSPSGLMARINQILFPSQKEMFFSSLPIFVEGIEDVAYISTQMELAGQLSNFKKFGCHFIIAGGKTNISRLLGIAIELDLPYYVIFDSDSDSDRQQQERDNKCILNLIGASIDDCLPSKNIWGTNYVLWSENIGKQIQKDFGNGTWDKFKELSLKELGLIGTGNSKKNTMVISATLQKLFKDSKQSPLLIKLCGSILRYAEQTKIA